MLSFIGTGSAFNTRLCNTSAFIKVNTSLVLIDCGGMIFHKLQEKRLLEDVENIYIIITHTHPDHVGSLGDIIFYSHYIMNIKIRVLFPEKNPIEDLLAAIGVSKEIYELIHNHKISLKDENLGTINIEYFRTTHVQSIPAFGFTLEYKDDTIFYSGDSNYLSEEIIEKLRKKEISRIYHDVTSLDYEKNSHLSLRKLKESISHELRDKVYCMHFDKDVDFEEIKGQGFNIVEAYDNNE